jgi:L-rhamnose isomerase
LSVGKGKNKTSKRLIIDRRTKCFIQAHLRYIKNRQDKGIQEDDLLDYAKDLTTAELATKHGVSLRVIQKFLTGFKGVQNTPEAKDFLRFAFRKGVRPILSQEEKQKLIAELHKQPYRKITYRDIQSLALKKFKKHVSRSVSSEIKTNLFR